MFYVEEPHLSRGADLVLIVVVEHPTPGLHHGALQAAGQSCGGRETPSWLLQSLPSLNTMEAHSLGKIVQTLCSRWLKLTMLAPRSMP